jgi:hypothetical protein
MSEGQHLSSLCIQRDQSLVPEDRADDAGLLQRELFQSRQAIQPCLQHARQRDRHMGDEQPLGVDTPGLARLDGPLVDQHLDQLFHVEGVALRRRGDKLAQRAGTWAAS